jgi:hypothetical protein
MTSEFGAIAEIDLGDYLKRIEEEFAKTNGEHRQIGRIVDRLCDEITYTIWKDSRSLDGANCVPPDTPK